MKKYIAIAKFSLIILLSLFLAKIGFAQYDFKNTEITDFRRQEFNWGLHYSHSNEREETRTEFWREYDELQTNATKFQINNRYLNFKETKQERVEFNLEAGPLWGNGNWVDSSSIANTEADNNIFGLRTYASANYSSRFYYNDKNYTLVQVNGWGRYDLYNQNSTGISTDSNMVVSDFDDETTENKFRFGFEARAGWGIGRLKPMNDFMAADYILKKYYNKNNLSQNEILELANEIGRIKAQRNFKTGHKTEVETAEMQKFLNEKMFLIPTSSMEEEWKLTEFLPRFTGSRIEFGPFFKYLNYEPDFIYGGYFLFEHAKYCTFNWNRYFSAGVNYNAYKKQDWILGEVSMGWSYFIKFKSQFNFGVKYIPGLALDGSESAESLNHGFIPSVGYFTQIDSKNRINLKFAYRFSEDEKLMLNGPEISVSVYRSRY